MKILENVNTSCEFVWCAVNHPAEANRRITVQICEQHDMHLVLARVH